MKKFFGRVRMAEPEVSDAEQELFGGPLRYDMGWSEHERARLDLTMLSALRSMPRLVGATLRMAWQADRRALLTVAVSEIGQGLAAAVGLLAVNAVMHALLGSGTPGQRLHAILPGLLTAAAAAVVNSGLAGWSTSRAGRLEPLIERIATTQYLAAAASVELEAIEDPEFRRLIDVAQYGAGSARRMIGACVAALNGTISLISTAGVLTILHPVLLPMLLLIAAPRGWGAMRVAQERYVSVMSWVEHVRASRLIGNLLTERTAAQEVRIHAVGPFLLSRYERMGPERRARAGAAGRGQGRHRVGGRRAVRPRHGGDVRGHVPADHERPHEPGRGRDRGHRRPVRLGEPGRAGDEREPAARGVPLRPRPRPVPGRSGPAHHPRRWRSRPGAGEADRPGRGRLSLPGPGGPRPGRGVPHAAHGLGHRRGRRERLRQEHADEGAVGPVAAAERDRAVGGGRCRFPGPLRGLRPRRAAHPGLPALARDRGVEHPDRAPRPGGRGRGPAAVRGLRGRRAGRRETARGSEQLARPDVPRRERAVRRRVAEDRAGPDPLAQLHLGRRRRAHRGRAHLRPRSGSRDRRVRPHPRAGRPQPCRRPGHPPHVRRPPRRPHPRPAPRTARRARQPRRTHGRPGTLRRDVRRAGRPVRPRGLRPPPRLPRRRGSRMTRGGGSAPRGSPEPTEVRRVPVRP
ncbi:ABC transporter, permease/ATP-binding protein [Streptomyces sp. e14]|nr:ABC transporter, permease/ATP-binding protein [Streptomyces sp. e14]